MAEPEVSTQARGTHVCTLVSANSGAQTGMAGDLLCLHTRWNSRPEVGDCSLRVFLALPCSCPTSARESFSCFVEEPNCPRHTMAESLPDSLAPDQETQGAHATSTHPQPLLPRLDITSLEGDVQQFLAAGVAESTLKVYRAGWHKYQTFSSQFSISPTPITVKKVTLFIAFLGNQSLAVSTIESYIAALRFFRVLSDPSCLTPSFHTPCINLLIWDIKQSNASRKVAHMRLSITIMLMQMIKQSLAINPHSYENVFFEILCLSEVRRVSDSRRCPIQPASPPVPQ